MGKRLYRLPTRTMPGHGIMVGNQKDVAHPTVLLVPKLCLGTRVSEALLPDTTAKGRRQAELAQATFPSGAWQPE